MKVLHTTLQSKPTAGVINQMDWEEKASRSLGINWDVIVYCPLGVLLPGNISMSCSKVKLLASDGFLGRAIKLFRLRREYYRWLSTQQNNYDVFVLRYLPFEIHQLIFLLRCRCPVYFVYHTLDIPELRSRSGSLKWIKLLIEHIVGPLSIRYSSGLVGVTDEIRKYQCQRVPGIRKPSYLYPNGICFMADQGPVEDRRRARPEVLFVASHFYDWHGLDLLLSSMLESDDDFTLHLVGELDPGDRLVAEKDSRIMLHGSLGSCEIMRLSQSCWVGLSSFALTRKSMNEACTLKVREYMRTGLPVYSGHKDVFPIDFAYYKIGACSVTAILEYARSVREVSRSEVVDAVRPFIDKEKLLTDFYGSLDS